ncbi:MAG: CsbD family protein [Gallionellaceae bacterium]
MNKNQIKGAVKDISGKVQEEVGKLVGSKEQQAKGLRKQLSGKVEKVLGNTKEAFTNTARP